MTRRISTLIFILSMFQPLLAGAGTLKQKSLYAGYSYSHSQTELRTDKDGNEIKYPLNIFQSFHLFLAYGVIDRLTVYGSLSYAANTEENNPAIDVSTFTDAALGAKFGLLSQSTGDFATVSAGLDAKIPVTDYYRPQHTNPGDAQVDLTPALYLEKYIGLGPVAPFIDSIVGYRVRFQEPPDRFFVYNTLGVYFLKYFSAGFLYNFDTAFSGVEFGTPGWQYNNLKTSVHEMGAKLGAYWKGVVLELKYVSQVASKGTVLFNSVGAHLGYLFQF